MWGQIHPGKRSPRTTRLLSALAFPAAFLLPLPPAAYAARVAHEGFLTPSTVSSVLSGAGHVPVSLTAAQVEGGALMASHFDVFVIGRNTASHGASALYVAQVGAYMASGGNVVAEFTGAGMFFSGYASDVTPTSALLTPQLHVFDGLFHAGAFHQAQTP